MGDSGTGPLTQLFGSGKVQEFADAYWARQPMVGLCEAELLDLFDDTCTGLRRLVERGMTEFRVQSGHGSAELTFAGAAEASSAFESGSATVVAQNVDRAVPLLRSWFARLLEDLGVPVDKLSGNVYFSPPRGGLGRHFDGHEVVVVGLEGSKTFRIAPSSSLFPESNDSALPDPLGRIRAERLMHELPGTFEVEVRRGTALHVPRGWWHETSTKAGSATLTIGIWTKTYGEMGAGIDLGQEGFRPCDLRHSSPIVDLPPDLALATAVASLRSLAEYRGSVR